MECGGGWGKVIRNSYCPMCLVFFFFSQSKLNLKQTCNVQTTVTFSYNSVRCSSFLWQEVVFFYFSTQTELPTAVKWQGGTGRRSKGKKIYDFTLTLFHFPQERSNRKPGAARNDMKRKYKTKTWPGPSVLNTLLHFLLIPWDLKIIPPETLSTVVESGLRMILSRHTHMCKLQAEDIGNWNLDSTSSAKFNSMTKTTAMTISPLSRKLPIDAQGPRQMSVKKVTLHTSHNS